GVEQEHAVGRGFHRREELGEMCALELGLALETAQASLDAVRELAPEPRIARRGRAERAAPQPPQQAPAAQRVDEDDAEKAEQPAEQRADDRAALVTDEQADQAAEEDRQRASEETGQQARHRRLSGAPGSGRR